MKFARISNFLFLLVEVANVACRGPDVVFYRLRPCESEVESGSKIECTEDKEEKGTYNLGIVLDRDLDLDDVEYFAKVHKWDVARQDWESDLYEFDGPISYGINRYFPVAWDKIIAASKPPIEDKNFLPAGTYEMKNVKLSSSDTRVPSGLEGRFTIDFSMLNSDNEPWFCVGVEVEISHND